MCALVGRIAREFKIRQADPVNKDLVRAHGRGRFEARVAAAGYEIVLIHAIAGLYQQLQNPSEYDGFQFAAQMRKVNALLR